MEVSGDRLLLRVGDKSTSQYKWEAEYGISYSKLNITPGEHKTVGISFGYNEFYGNRTRWPSGASIYDPSTWANLYSTNNWSLPGVGYFSYGDIPVVVDGNATDECEWVDADRLSFSTIGGAVTTYVKHDQESIYLRFYVPNNYSQSGMQVFLDSNLSGGVAPQVDDFRLTVWHNGSVAESRGNGSSWVSQSSSGWTGASFDAQIYWEAEVNISFDKLGVTNGTHKIIGIGFVNTNVNNTDYHWPSDLNSTNPDTWNKRASSDNWSLGEVELYFDDCTFEGSVGYSSAGYGVAINFTSPYPINITKLRYYIDYYQVPLEVHLWNISVGMPGANLITPFNTTPSTYGWHTVDLPAPVTVDSGKFFGGIVWLQYGPQIGIDNDAPHNTQALRYNGSEWSNLNSIDWGIRAVGTYYGSSTTSTTMPPNVTLNSPYYNDNYTAGPIPYNFSVSDDRSLKNISLYNNRTGVWEWNVAFVTSQNGTRTYNQSTSITYEGYILWNVLAYDTGGQYSWGTTNLTFYVYSTTTLSATTSMPLTTTSPGAGSTTLPLTTTVPTTTLSPTQSHQSSMLTGWNLISLPVNL